MAAGLGFKEFTTGDVLTAADANGYLASQVVMVFASAAARTSAIASPQEGMISFLKDTNSTEYYSGSAWVAIGGGSVDSMTLLSTTTLTGSSVTISSISGSYKRLILVCRSVQPATNSVAFNMRFNADTGSNYDSSALDGSGNFVAASSIEIGSSLNSSVTNTGFEIQIPDYATSTSYKSALWIGTGTRGGGTPARFGMGGHWANTAAITSITFFPSSGSFTAGTILTYGVN